MSGTVSTMRAAVIIAPCSPCRNWLICMHCSARRTRVSSPGSDRRFSNSDAVDRHDLDRHAERVVILHRQGPVDALLRIPLLVLALLVEVEQALPLDVV